MNELKSPDKPFEISKWAVQEAWEKVKANKGAPGVDGVSIEGFEADLHNNLYKVWNRMSSGSYFPPPVRAVEIPKPHGGGTRMLGVPRRRHSAASSSDDLGFVVVTHPFHPLIGQRLEVLYVKRRAGDTVFVCSGGVGGQITVPQAWTDRGEPARSIGCRSRGLAALAAVTRAIWELLIVMAWCRHYLV